jgi:hypothetical protein
VEVTDKALYEKYELINGGAMLAGDKQLPIYDEIWGMPGRLAIPGGSGLNSARGANFILKN